MNKIRSRPGLFLVHSCGWCHPVGAEAVSGLLMVSSHGFRTAMWPDGGG